MDVSVIIPVYNVEEYLDQCLLSVEDNDEVALEIICVNDGSTDGSLAIMRDHAARDGRVRIIDKENVIEFPLKNKKEVATDIINHLAEIL